MSDEAMTPEEHDADIARSVLREIAEDDSATTDERLQAASQLMMSSFGTAYGSPDFGIASDELADAIAQRLKAKGIRA